MSLLLQLHHRVKMLMVDVSVNSEQALQDSLGHRHEVLRERHSYLGREKSLIVQLVLHPGHQIVNVFGSRALDGLLNVCAVSPVVFIPWSSRHHRTASLSAELSYGAIQHIDLVEEIHSVDCDPLVEIFPLWKHHSLPQVTTTKRGLGMFQQLVLVRAFWDVLLRLERLG